MVTNVALLTLAITAAVALTMAVFEYLHRREIRTREAGKQAWLDIASRNDDPGRLEAWLVNPSSDDAGGA
jgi:hypothetical protein